MVRDPCPTIAATVDSVNNSWACLRTVAPGEDELYCRFWSGFAPRTASAAIHEEYYNMSADAWQLREASGALSPQRRAELQANLTRLMGCKGAQCRAG